MRWLAVLLVLCTPLYVSSVTSASLWLTNRQDAKNAEPPQDKKQTQDQEFERAKKEYEKLKADVQKQIDSSHPLVTTSRLSVEVQTAKESPRKEISLNRQWRFRRDDQKDWKSVTLPTHWETHEGLKFDGIGWYEKTLEPITLAKGRRLLLHFDAVATHATVYWNDVKLGEHLGAWTPFRFDVTEQIQKNPTAKQTIRVRVDEKVGHNTQGFLPIIQPHFGGIWQGIKLIEVPTMYINDLETTVNVDPKKQAVQIAIHLRGDNQIVTHAEAKFEQIVEKSKRFAFSMSVYGAFNTSVAENGTIVLNGNDQFLKDWHPSKPVTYLCTISLEGGDRTEVHCAHRTIETKTDQFLLNGQPLSIRGVLNWGYYPPSLSPNPSEEVWRNDLKLIKSWGFNLMKCCLWVPPKRLLEIADEEGVLIWLEYPTWHPQLTPKYEAELLREYKEFHQHDRNHPSVILRSLTCETGPGADLGVIKKLYDQCKQMCGGLVVDDSSWIEWNRICDFYDDHPYGNNHTWVKTLTRLKDYIAHSKLGVKPLCLGEAIAADTWVPTKPMLEAIAKAKADPKQAWSLDERGYPYWVPGFFDANQAWLKRMEKVCGGPIDEKKLEEDSLRYAWLMRKYQIEAYRHDIPNGGYVVSVLRDFQLASMGLLDYQGQPKWKIKEWEWHAEKPSYELEYHQQIARGWDMEMSVPFRSVSKLDQDTLDFLEKGGNVLLRPDGKQGSFPLRSHWFLRGGPFVNQHAIMNAYEAVANLYEDSWGEVVKSTKEYLRKQGPKTAQFLIENQHFELSSDVIPDINYLEEIEPVLMLWDNHDIKEVKTHGLIFQTQVGKGRLIVVATANKRPEIMELINALLQGPPPRNALKPETIARMRAKLNEKRLDLVAKSWQFMPDGKEEGLKLGWHKPDFDDKAWKPIKIGKHWEAQGYPDLDGWAWYRLKVEIPKDWAGVPIYLNSEGVDDAYEIYINGTKIGAGGDIPNKKTAFEERKAHAMPPHLLKPGESNLIAVRVYDWYGAGGIHRPMTLSNMPIGGVDILK